MTRPALSLPRHRWRAALAGSALAHLLVLAWAVRPTLLPAPATAPAEPAVEMVFAPPAAPEPPPAPETPEPRSVEPPPSPAPAPRAEPENQAPPSPEPQYPEAPASPPAPPAEPEDHAPPPPDSRASQAEPAPKEAEPQASTLPALPPPPPPRKAEARPRKPAAPHLPARAPSEARSAPPSAAEAPAPPARLPPTEDAPHPSQAPAASIAWRQALAAWLAAHKTYPDEARRRGIEGNIALRFSIDRSGHVSGITVLHGSGSPVLDSAAEAMLRGAVVPPPPLAGEASTTVSIQVHYRLTE